MDARDVRRGRGYSRPVAPTTITDVMRAYADGTVAYARGTIHGRPPDAVWEAVTTRSKRMTSYYRTLLVAIGRGTRSESGTAMQVSLPPLSTVPRRDPAR